MRVEMWPSTTKSQPDCYISLDLSPDTIDYLMGQSSGLISQWSMTGTVRSSGGAFRYRIKSPLMLLTVCQGHQSQCPELEKLTNILKDAADLHWEMRIPTNNWGIEGDDTEKEEVPI